MPRFNREPSNRPFGEVADFWQAIMGGLKEGLRFEPASFRLLLMPDDFVKSGR
jgi:hypothetical protein